MIYSYMFCFVNKYLIFEPGVRLKSFVKSILFFIYFIFLERSSIVESMHMAATKRHRDRAAKITNSAHAGKLHKVKNYDFI